MSKIILPAVLVILTLYFTFPKYIGYVAIIGEDTFLLLATGKDTRGIGSYRVTGTGDLLVTKKYINNNLLFGTGYTYLYWGEKTFASSPRGAKYALAADAAGEVPIYYLFFGFGIAGAILMFPLYFIMAKLFFRLNKLLKQNLSAFLHDPFIILFSIYVLLTIASKFTFNVFNLSSDFRGSQLSSTAVFLGLGFALLKKINENLEIFKKDIC